MAHKYINLIAEFQMGWYFRSHQRQVQTYANFLSDSALQHLRAPQWGARRQHKHLFTKALEYALGASYSPDGG